MMSVMCPPPNASSVSCPCGAQLTIDPDETTQETACPECGQTLEVIVSVDPRTKQAKLGILVKAGAVTPRQRRGKDAKGEEIHTAKCVCGAQITIEPGGVDAVYSCAACHADYTASLKKSRNGGSSTLLLRPLVAAPMSKTTRRSIVKPATPPKPTKSAAPPPPPTKVFPKLQVFAPSPSPVALAAKEKFLMMAKSEVAAQEFSDGRIQCFCKASITLREGYNREIVKCPGCGTGFRVFKATNPKNGDPMAVMIPRG
jgi:ssDNA-binding Zn-finger/Zn-ribbon topoisomerase 1